MNKADKPADTFTPQLSAEWLSIHEAACFLGITRQRLADFDSVLKPFLIGYGAKRTQRIYSHASVAELAEQRALAAIARADAKAALASRARRGRTP